MAFGQPHNGARPNVPQERLPYQPMPGTQRSIYEAIPRLYPDSTIVCMGSGPSLVMEDVRLCYERAIILAINDAWRLTGTKADVLFAADAKWWQWNADDPDVFFPYHLWTVDPNAKQWRPYVHCVNYKGEDGISDDPSVIRHGGHGGYMAINIARLFGARKIVLLGYDMMPSAVDGRHHFFGEHPDGNHVNYDLKVGIYAALPRLLADRNIEIVNASRVTAIPSSSIPRQLLAEALA